MRSGFLPSILGVLLIVGFFTYLVVSLTWFLLPSYLGIVNRLATVPEAAAEFPISLWLLIKGVKVEPLAARATAT